MLFPAEDGGLLDPDLISRRFRETTRRAGVRELRFHDLRHTFCSRLAAAGVHIRQIQEWAGHSQIQTTMGYMHYAPGPEDADQLSRANAPKPLPRSDDGEVDRIDQLQRQIAEMHETLTELVRIKTSSRDDPRETT